MTALSPAQTETRSKLFYGWRVLAVIMAGSFFAATMAQLYVGAMLPHIEDDTGWNRSSITLAVTIGSVLAGFVSPFFGRLADLHGPRILCAAGLLITVGAMFGIGWSGSAGIAVFYVSSIIGRSVGQNALSGVVARTAAVNWFKRMRGRALGMTQMAVPLGGAALIPLSQAMISLGMSWQTVYYSLGAFMLFFLMPPILLVLRRRPEDMGLLPDGDSAPPVDAARPEAAAILEDNWTLQEAMRTRALWLLIAAMSIGICANGAISFHLFAYYGDQGISTAVASLAISVYALCGATANGLWGFIIERIPERVVGAATVSIAAVLCLFLLTVDVPVEALVFAVLFGLMARGEGSIIVAMQADYYGRGSFGTISGFTTPFQQVALGLGPIIAAVCYDATGRSYDVAFILFAAMFALSAGLIWMARKPERPFRQPASAA
jgi:MFS family permease